MSTERQIVLDTETTGLEPEFGHRIIEIGALELVDRQLTGKQMHVYLNPEREIDEGALEVHGITLEFLQDKPRFHEIAGDFLAFIEGAELVIHNAPFDVGFLDYELSLLGGDVTHVAEHATVLDTLELARDMHPGQRNNLDALCKRYEIDNTGRALHGALLDAELLTEVYLAMTGGQEDLGLSLETLPDIDERRGGHDPSKPRPALRVLRASDEELSHHNARLKAIRKQAGECLWLSLEDELDAVG